MVQLHFPRWDWRKEGLKEEEPFCLDGVRNERAECPIKEMRLEQRPALLSNVTCRRSIWEKARQCQRLKDDRS